MILEWIVTRKTEHSRASPFQTRQRPMAGSHSSSQLFFNENGTFRHILHLIGPAQGKPPKKQLYHHGVELSIPEQPPMRRKRPCRPRRAVGKTKLFRAGTSRAHPRVPPQGDGRTDPSSAGRRAKRSRRRHPGCAAPSTRCVSQCQRARDVLLRLRVGCGCVCRVQLPAAG